MRPPNVPGLDCSSGRVRLEFSGFTAKDRHWLLTMGLGGRVACAALRSVMTRGPTRYHLAGWLNPNSKLVRAGTPFFEKELHGDEENISRMKEYSGPSPAQFFSPQQ